ncbi:MAG: AAA family ATPase, partial [Muribaculaceae bacterium]|nr:AAA family ATPase [Muribaculaceae bacterium]
MDESRRYPIGQQNFRELRRQGALYVDKTPYLEKIVKNSTQYWFLARPR